MKFPTIETSRLHLTQISPTDTNAIFELFSNPEVVKHYDLDVFKEKNEATKLIAFFNTRFNESTGIRWAIRLKDTNQLIGTCGFNSWNIKMKNAVIGYDLLPEYWRKGYTTEAVNSIIKAAFSGELPCGELHRIQADTVIDNASSEALLLKVGFKEEGIRRESGYWKNQFHDLKCFGILKTMERANYPNSRHEHQ